MQNKILYPYLSKTDGKNLKNSEKIQGLYEKHIPSKKPRGLAGIQDFIWGFSPVLLDISIAHIK